MAAPQFLTLDAVEYGSVEQVSPLIRRIVANNPSKFTYLGTGTYIVGHGDVVVIDPGPELDSHHDALAAALVGERVRAILVTHCHADHSPLAAWLRTETNAPTYAYGPHPRPDPADEPDASDDDDNADGDDADVKIEESTDFDFEPDERVVDGEQVIDLDGVTMRAVHTPGHTSNHMCWTLEQEGALFTGDHVMGWSTTVVSPPDGNMADYMESLRRVAGRNDQILWPTHGPPRTDAAHYVNALIDHREAREAAVLAAVRRGQSTIPEIVADLYADVRKELHKPAGRSVWAHLEQLVEKCQVQVEGSGSSGLSSVYRPL